VHSYKADPTKSKCIDLDSKGHNICQWRMGEGFIQRLGSARVGSHRGMGWISSTVLSPLNWEGMTGVCRRRCPGLGRGPKRVRSGLVWCVDSLMKMAQLESLCIHGKKVCDRPRRLARTSVEAARMGSCPPASPAIPRYLGLE